MDAQRFDHITKALTRARDRRAVLKRTGGGVLAVVLGGREATFAHHKPKHPKHCAKTRCEDSMVCGVKSVHCDVRPGTGCSCVLTVEGCRACIDENFCLDPCQSSVECETKYGRGAICQDPNSGCCGQTCLRPCPD